MNFNISLQCASYSFSHELYETDTEYVYVFTFIMSLEIHKKNAFPVKVECQFLISCCDEIQEISYARCK